MFADAAEGGTRLWEVAGLLVLVPAHPGLVAAVGLDLRRGLPGKLALQGQEELVDLLALGGGHLRRP